MQNSLTLNRGFDIERGVDFFNRVFIQSLQNSLQEHIVAPKVETKADIDSILYSFYELRVVDDKLVTIELDFMVNGSIKRDVKVLNSGSWQEFKIEDDLILINGKWSSRGKFYKIESNSIVVDNIFKIDIIDSKRVQKIDDISFPSNSRVIKSQVTQLKDLYILDRELESISLREFIKKYSLFNCFDGFCGGGISFGDVKEGQREGDIWYLNGFETKKVVSKDAGRWHLREVDKTEILIVEIKGYDRVIYANVGEKLFSGKVQKPIQREWISYNKSAFEAIKRALSL